LSVASFGGSRWLSIFGAWGLGVDVAFKAPAVGLVAGYGWDPKALLLLCLTCWDLPFLLVLLLLLAFRLSRIRSPLELAGPMSVAFWVGGLTYRWGLSRLMDSGGRAGESLQYMVSYTGTLESVVVPGLVVALLTYIVARFGRSCHS